MRDWSQRKVYAGFLGGRCVAIADMPGESPISGLTQEDTDETLMDWKRCGFEVKIMTCAEASAAHLASLGH